MFLPFRSVLLPLALVTPLSLHAQVVGGTISGTVVDPKDALVPNAHVTLRNEDTGAQRSLSTSEYGSFAASSLSVGPYAIEVSAAGFATYTRRDVVLTVGQSLNLNLALTLSGSETINVQSTPATINTSTEQVAGLVDSRQVKELPLNGRSYDQLLSLNPATVNATNQRSGSVGTSNSSVGSMFSIAGRRPQDNLFLLNGIEYTGASLINVTPGGTSGQLLGVDGIREFNVVSDTYSAAYGKRDGAQVSIVTTGGTNAFHGSLFEFTRNSYLDARNYFDGPRIPEFQRNDFGAALGGPLHRDKAFLFANYEGYRQNLGESLVTLVPDAASRAKAADSVKPLLNLWPVANGREITSNGTPTGIAQYIGTAPQHIREDFGTARFDQNIGQKDTLYSVYTVDDSTASTPSSNPYSYVNESLREQVFSLQEQHVFNRVVNVARFGYSRASFYFLGYVPAAQQSLAPSVRAGVPTYAVVIAGSTASNGAASISPAGANVGSDNAITRNLFTFDDHAYYTVGRHTIQAGVWIQQLQSNDDLAQDKFGQASFASLAAFLSGNIKAFTYTPVTTRLNWRALYVNAFVEDTYRINSRLEARIGFRSESSTGWNEAHGKAGVYTFTGGVIDSAPSVGQSALRDNRARFLPEPRVGLAWNVFGSGRTSITIAAGLHHSLLDALDYRLDQAAPYNTVYTYSGTTVANPTSSKPLVSPSTVDTSIATPTLLAYDVKLEQQIAPAMSLTLSYGASHSYHQILNGDLNEPAFTTLADGTIYYPTTTKANPAVSNTTSWWAGGSGNYNALIADLRRNLSHHLQVRANYTWSKNLDDGSAWNTSVSSNTPAFVSVPSRPHLDYGPAATDIRHVVALNGTYSLPLGRGESIFGNAGNSLDRLVSGWSLSSIASLFSGFPFSPQLGYNPTGSGDSRNPVRPDVNPAFAGSLYSHGNTSARAAQFFNPSAFAAPAYGTVGNVRRDSLRGPAFADWDVSLVKSTQLGEHARLQLRAEFFNVLNHTNLQLPNEIVFATGPTQGTRANQTSQATLGSPGVISATANTSRQIQLAAKIVF